MNEPTVTTSSLVNQNRASGLQAAVFNQHVLTLNHRLIYAYIGELNQLILDYRTQGGSYVRARYDTTGMPVGKRYFRAYNFYAKQPILPHHE